MVSKLNKPIWTLASIIIAFICFVLLIVIAATPSYFNSPYSQTGAWKYCATGFSVNTPHSIMSRTHRLRTFQQTTINLPPGVGGGSITVPGGGSVTIPNNPVGGGSITVPGGGSIPVSGNPQNGGTITVDCTQTPQFCNMAGGGSTISAGGGTPGSGIPSNPLPSNPNLPVPNPANPSTVPYCSSRGLSLQACIQACATTPSNCYPNQPPQRQQGGGGPEGPTVCGTDTTNGDSKTGAIRGFLVLAILLCVGVIVLSILSILLSSHTSLLLMIAAGLCVASGLSALISWAVVVSLIQGADGVKLWYGFGLQVVVNVVMWIVGGMLIKASLDAKGNQVTQATIQHTKANQGGMIKPSTSSPPPVPLQPTNTNQQWQQPQTQTQPQYGYPQQQPPQPQYGYPQQQQPQYGYPQQQPQYGYPRSQPYGTSPPMQANPAYNQQYV